MRVWGRKALRRCSRGGITLGGGGVLCGAVVERYINRNEGGG